MFFYPRALCPVLLLPLLLGGALSGEVTAQPAAQSSAPEEERDRPTGEPEELPELIPEQTIPWHDSLVELPLWMNQERMEIESRTRPANQGGGLFPPEVWPLQPGPELAPLVRDDQPVAAPPPEPGQEPVTLGPELMALYTARPPAGVFIDPQHLVQGRSSGVMESLVQRWLNDQCPFRTTVLVFGAGQQLPADFDPQALRRQWFPDSPAALLVFYFHHQPERTLAIFGSEARGTYGEGVVRSVVDAAVTEAGRVQGGTEQLERFCYKMSVRLHWLALTHEARMAELATARRLHPEAARFQFHTLLLAGGGAAAAVGLGLAGWAWRRHRRRAGFGSLAGPVVFPDWEVTPRLGAPHSGGFSAMISFPPAPSAE